MREMNPRLSSRASASSTPVVVGCRRSRAARIRRRRPADWDRPSPQPRGARAPRRAHRRKAPCGHGANTARASRRRRRREHARPPLPAPRSRRAAHPRVRASPGRRSRPLRTSTQPTAGFGGVEKSPSARELERARHPGSIVLVANSAHLRVFSLSAPDQSPSCRSSAVRGRRCRSRSISSRNASTSWKLR